MIRIELSDLAETSWDLLVVGGGATGLGVALQAALEGRRVVLIEARDYACGTSSRSTKLLHGGVRYLAQGRVGLVREALRERATVLNLAPHLAQPLPFVVAEKRWLAWAATALGLKAYQWLAGRYSLGASRVLSVAGLASRMPALPGVVAGVEYWDGQFDDARLALALARTAHQAGAQMRNHTALESLQRDQDGCGWQAGVLDVLTGERATLRARAVVNAAGVWVDGVRAQALQQGRTAVPQPIVRPSQGVHVVVPREVLPLESAVLVPRTTDGRVLFAVPWLGSTVIGTTDTPRTDAPLEPRPQTEELDFIFGEARRSLGILLDRTQVRSVWVGLRPLVDLSGTEGGSTAQLSREHVILREVAGFITVTGGKWTTYRSMAEDVVAELARDEAEAGVAVRPSVSTHTYRLFGAPSLSSAASIREVPGLHLLGTEADTVAVLPGHDEALGLGLTAALVRYAARHEQAVTVEDMLARRWRMLFLDARLAGRIAPRVAQILHEQTGHDPQLQAFVTLCRQYLLDDGFEADVGHGDRRTEEKTGEVHLPEVGLHENKTRGFAV
ncbi:MAG: glycerol-3-phosphate dehydrogenase/oxidase [Comamonas sp.]